VYAQLVRSRTTNQKRAEMHRIVADELIPALHDEPGFAGALSLVSPRDGETIMIVLWQSAEQAQSPLGDNGTSVLAPLLLRAGIAGAAPGEQQRTSVWDVTVRV
jgi:hypothetical protein